uniref:HTH psq-type domain-containing protein n=1 Tax=Canis lupus familiaris TaxID=9615 RepID=A0A8C0S4N4_CANLF
MASKQAAGRSPGEKRKRVVLTLKEKIDICTRLEKGESRKVLMQEYNVGMSTLYDIKAHKAQLLRGGAAAHTALSVCQAAAGEAAARGPQGRGQTRDPPGGLPSALLVHGRRALTSAQPTRVARSWPRRSGHPVWGLGRSGWPIPVCLSSRAYCAFRPGTGT